MKRMQKRIRMLLLALLAALLLAACGSQEAADTPAGRSEPAPADSGSETALTDAAQSEPVQSDGYEKFSRLAMGMTREEVDAILGEPVRTDKAYHYYEVTVNGQPLELEVWINTVSGLVIYINGDFYKDGLRAEFADEATDFSGVDGLDSGALDTYEACAEAFGTPGYRITLDEDGATRFLWVDKNDGHMCVSFRADGTVRSYSGLC